MRSWFNNWHFPSHRQWFSPPILNPSTKRLSKASSSPLETSEDVHCSEDGGFNTRRQQYYTARRRCIIEHLLSADGHGRTEQQQEHVIQSMELWQVSTPSACKQTVEILLFMYVLIICMIKVNATRNASEQTNPAVHDGERRRWF